MRGKGKAGETGVHWSLRGRAACAKELLTQDVCSEDKKKLIENLTRDVVLLVTCSRLAPITIDVFLVVNSSNFLATPRPRNYSN